MERAPLPMKDWGDDRDKPGIGIRLEFGLIVTALVAAALFALYAFVVPSPANAHPGGLAADGCHNDRKNGGRHCHRGPKAGQTVTPPAGGGVYYPNCAAARAAGAAPIYRGQPGYASHLDRDGDGIACE